MDMTPASDTKKLAIVVVAAACGSLLAGLFGSALYASFGAKAGGAEAFGGSDSCNVVGISVHGEIVASRDDIPVTDSIPVQQPDGSSVLQSPGYTVSSEIEDALRAAASDPSVKGALIDVDSPGGGAEAGSEIARAIRAFGKPTVAVIREIGASSGYLSASAADLVIASPDSTVGSIGATESYVDQSKKNAQDGLTYNSLSSGPYKDMFDPNAPLSPAQKALAMRDIALSKEIFVNLVAEFRHQPTSSIEALADGSTVMGQAALENHLIDQLGGTQDGLDYLKGKIGEDPIVCWQ